MKQKRQPLPRQNSCSFSAVSSTSFEMMSSCGMRAHRRPRARISYQEDDPATKADLWVLPLVGDAKPTRVVATPFSEFGASCSPDGRWIAYTSDESGQAQVFVQSFPLAGEKWQVSATNGCYPRWRQDGKELFFDNSGTLMAVDLTGTVPGGMFKAGDSKTWVLSPGS